MTRATWTASPSVSQRSLQSSSKHTHNKLSHTHTTNACVFQSNWTYAPPLTSHMWMGRVWRERESEKHTYKWMYVYSHICILYYIVYVCRFYSSRLINAFAQFVRDAHEHLIGISFLNVLRFLHELHFVARGTSTLTVVYCFWTSVYLIYLLKDSHNQKNARSDPSAQRIALSQVFVGLRDQSRSRTGVNGR